MDHLSNGDKLRYHVGIDAKVVCVQDVWGADKVAEEKSSRNSLLLMKTPKDSGYGFRSVAASDFVESVSHDAEGFIPTPEKGTWRRSAFLWILWTNQ